MRELLNAFKMQFSFFFDFEHVLGFGKIMGDMDTLFLDSICDFFFKGKRNIEEFLIIDILFLRLEVQQIE
jgi:hypothetical protein